MMIIVPKLAPKAVSVSVSPVLAEVVWFDILSCTSLEVPVLVHAATPNTGSNFEVVKESSLDTRDSLLLGS